MGVLDQIIFEYIRLPIYDVRACFVFWTYLYVSGASQEEAF